MEVKASGTSRAGHRPWDETKLFSSTEIFRRRLKFRQWDEFFSAKIKTILFRP